MKQHQLTTGPQILRLPAVMSKTGMSRAWIYREIAAKAFPAPIKIGRSSGWDGSVIDAWVERKLSDASKPVGG